MNAEHQAAHATLPDPTGAFLAKHWTKMKLSFIALALISALVTVESRLFGTNEAIKSISLALGALIGFYGSELAKKAVRARQVANQAWAYVVNFAVLEQLLPIRTQWAPVVTDWVAAIEKGDVERQQLDRHYQDHIFSGVANFLPVISTNLENQKTCPGRVTATLETIASSLDELQNWQKYLPDEDIALLGPEILYEAVNYRASQIQCIYNSRTVFTHLKEADQINAALILDELQRMSYFFIRAAVSLERLMALVPCARGRGLLQHTKQLIGPL